MVDSLDDLVCPRCKSPLDRDVKSTDDGAFGHLNCPCHSYPVVAGVPVIQRNALVEQTADLVANGRRDAAVATLLNRSRRSFPARESLGRAARAVQSLPPPLRWYLRTAAVVEGRVGVETPATFTGLIDERVRGHFADYLRYRTVEQSFWGLHAVLPRIASRSGAVLDFGGGWGHSSQVVHASTDRRVCNVEIDFAPLYYQRRFFDEDISTVVVEPGGDLPFREDAFKTILDLDGFHYVPNKYSVAGEYERVAHPDGQILLLHAHNRGYTDRGDPLDADAYLDCFSWSGRVTPEESFLEAFLTGTDDFTVPAWPGSASQDLCLLFERDDTPDSTISLVDHPFRSITGPLVVNPLFDRTRSDAGLELSRGPVSDQFAEEFAFSLSHTDETYVLEEETDPFDPLVRGVLSPLPASYSPDEPVSLD